MGNSPEKKTIRLATTNSQCLLIDSYSGIEWIIFDSAHAVGGEMLSANVET